MRCGLISGALLALGTIAASAQTSPDAVDGAIAAARRANPALEVKIDPATGLPSRVRGLRAVADPAALLAASRDAQGAPSFDDVRRAVSAFMATSEIAAAFPQGTRATRDVVEMRRDPDVPGQTIARVTQKVGGVPVFGSSARYVVNPSLAVTEIVASVSTAAIETTTPRIAETMTETASSSTRRRGPASIVIAGIFALLTSSSRLRRTLAVTV
jgi:hypothetical protein